jgi:tetratricopeptide (TPR) repeat protein
MPISNRACRSTASSVALWAALALTCAVPPASPAHGQEGRSVSEQQRVTAVDVVVRFNRAALSQWSSGTRAPKSLGAEDFVVTVDGVARPVIGYEAFEHLEPAARSPWRQLLYVDCRATGTADLRRTASLLHGHLPALLQLGPLGIVLADPAPRVMLAPTKDQALLERTLSQLNLSQECHDESQELRDALLKALEQPTEEQKEFGRAGMIQAGYGAERDIVRRSALALLNTLTDATFAGGAQKVVYLVHNGFDDGREFFQSLDANAKLAADQGPTLSFQEAARLISSYGWTVVPTTQSVIEVSGDAIQLGRWQFELIEAGPEDFKADPLLTPPPGVATPLQADWKSYLAGIRGALREQRKPERAESYTELGEALLGQKKWADAEDAFRKALYHFDDGPKTRKGEARAWLGLGRALHAQGEANGRAAVDHAYELDAELQKQAGAPASTGLRQRGKLLAALAHASLGRTADDPRELDAMLADLQARALLTFQIAGDASGDLLPLKVTTAKGAVLDSPPFTRSATPPAVATARLLMAVDDELNATFPEDHGLDVMQAVAPGAASLDLGQLGGDGATQLRWTILRGTEDGSVRVDHQVVALATRSERGPTAQLALPPAVRNGYVAILVEDLESGDWGWYRKDGF